MPTLNQVFSRSCSLFERESSSSFFTTSQGGFPRTTSKPPLEKTSGKRSSQWKKLNSKHVLLICSINLSDISSESPEKQRSKCALVGIQGSLFVSFLEKYGAVYML